MSVRMSLFLKADAFRTGGLAFYIISFCFILVDRAGRLLYNKKEKNFHSFPTFLIYEALYI